MLSFADVKETSFVQARKTICRIIKLLYDRFDFLLEGDHLSGSEKEDFRRISVEMEDNTAAFSLKMLSIYLSRLVAKGIPRERIRKYGFAFCGKRVLIG